MAKDLGLFGKKKSSEETQESKERTKAVGNLFEFSIGAFLYLVAGSNSSFLPMIGFAPV
jgi:hypothetical protein